jgi:DNA polymerase III delta prime subunit
VTHTQPWTDQYRPKSKEEVVGNREAVDKLDKWIKSWANKPPKKRAAFVYGPPGTGKTAAVQALATEKGYDLLEINASDSRTKNRIEEVLGKAAGQTVTVFGRPRMILLDEMEGVSGQKDRGGITAISNVIKTTRIPIVLVSTTIGENMESKFRPLRDKATLIEFQPVPFGEVYKSLERISRENGVKVHPEALETLAIRSRGDLRSAINDLETVARGKTEVDPCDIEWMGERDRQDYTPNIINTIFSARSLWEARQTISQSMIPYEDLFDWIYENLPLVIDEPGERLQALETLAKADVYQKRARSSNYRLLKYMFNLMTGGVALSRTKSQGLGLMKQVHAAIQRNGLPLSNFQTSETKDGIMIKPIRWLGRDRWGALNGELRGMGASWTYGQNFWVLPYFREPQTRWRYMTTYYSRRNMKAVAAKLAAKTHTSTQEAVTETLPLLRIIYNADQENAEKIDAWLDLEDKEQDYLSG